MSTMTATEASDLFRREPDRFLDVGAGEAAYRVVGTGPDVLFVHGWPVSSATFRLLLPHLVDHVTCHLIDLPSAGSSRFDADTPMSIRQHIETVRRVVDLRVVSDETWTGNRTLAGGLLIEPLVTVDLVNCGLTLQPSELPYRFTVQGTLTLNFPSDSKVLGRIGIVAPGARFRYGRRSAP